MNLKEKEVKMKVQELRPYHWGILTQFVDESGSERDPFVDEIVSIRWSESGDYIWLGFDTHTTMKVSPNEMINVIPTNSESKLQEKYQNWTFPPQPTKFLDFRDSLAARAVACKNWDWLPGMQPRHPNSEPKFWFPRVGPQKGVRKGMLPDFEDDATVGLLLTLVRKAFYDEKKLRNGRIEVHQDHKNLYCVVQPFHDEKGALEYNTISVAITEVEALILALERA